MIQWTVAGLLLVISAETLGMRCDRTPAEVTKPPTASDGEFSIEILGDPTSYIPGNSYRIILKGATVSHEQRRFTNFLLLVEPKYSDDSQYNKSVGTLQLHEDMLTKYSDKCPNAVVHTNSVAKTQIQVLWMAPANGSGCIAVRATVVESTNKWYSEDGDLTKVLCEESQDNEDVQPHVLDQCCACHEAKYEVTFEGLWSRNTHPKDFPKNNWMTKFSDIIGASHTVDYAFWTYGGIASDGLRQLAEIGNTRELERELKDKSEHIRTIIKARGISYPNITGKTFAVFRVDKKHHLMSLVSMMHPSPDWIVGVSSLELCLKNCSWAESKILNLYPWDAGTDNGKTYMSKDLPANPRQPIRRITPSWPNDNESPFYDESGSEMKPLARLILSRQRLYEKNCNDDMDTYLDPNKIDGYCEVTDFSEWSSCSARCGKGMRHKQRRYKNQDLDYARQQSFCKMSLTKRSSCTAKTDKCFIMAANEADCELTKWGQWSSCSVSCGVGTKTKSRTYKTKSASKVCPFKFHAAPPLQQNAPCHMGECEHGQEVALPEECRERAWSEWSTCSATCGKGVKIRKKLPFIRNKNNQRNRRDDQTDVDDERTDEEEFDDGVDLCDDIKEVVECENDHQQECEEVPDSAIACTLPMEIGLCRTYTDKWYYNVQHGKCDLFSFSGCEGNTNNFKTLETCERVCGSVQEYKTKQNRRHWESLHGTHTQNDAAQHNLHEPSLQTGDLTNPTEVDVDCEVSEWTNWSPCDTTCGKGYRYRYRYVIREGINGGKKCPQKLLKKKRCKVHCKRDRHSVPSLQTGGLTNPTEEDVDCQVSEWTDWSPCDTTCGKGYRYRYRYVIISTDNHKSTKKCYYVLTSSPQKIRKKQKCEIHCELDEQLDRNTENANHVDCIMDSWSRWSPCSHTCGPNAVRLRTRKILVRPMGNGKPCTERVDYEPCNLSACHVY